MIILQTILPNVYPGPSSNALDNIWYKKRQYSRRKKNKYKHPEASVLRIYSDKEVLYMCDIVVYFPSIRNQSISYNEKWGSIVK